MQGSQSQEVVHKAWPGVAPPPSDEIVPAPLLNVSPAAEIAAPDANCTVNGVVV